MNFCHYVNNPNIKLHTKIRFHTSYFLNTALFCFYFPDYIILYIFVYEYFYSLCVFILIIFCFRCISYTLRFHVNTRRYTIVLDRNGHRPKDETGCSRSMEHHPSMVGRYRDQQLCGDFVCSSLL